MTHMFWYACILGLRISPRTLATNISTSSFFHCSLLVLIKSGWQKYKAAYAEVVGEEVHCPTFHAILPSHTVICPNLFKTWILRPWSYGPFEGLVLHVDKSSLVHEFFRLLSDVEGLSKYIAALAGHCTPSFQIRPCKRVVVTLWMYANFCLLKICTWFQSLVYFAV